jgi:Fe-S oxidoreductase
VGGYILFWGLTALALGLFTRRIYQLVRYLLLGRSEGSFGHVLRRALVTIGHVIGQWCQYRNLRRVDRAGLGHLFVAWGFLIFVTYYLLFIVIGAGFGISETMEENSFFAYYSWVMDIAGPLVMIGAMWAIIRRYVVRPARLKGQQTIEAMVILVTVLIHPITHLFKVGTAIAQGHAPAGLGVATPPISTAISRLFDGVASVDVWHSFWFWIHWGFVLFVLVYIGYSRYLHMIAGPLNDLLRPVPPRGMPAPIDLGNPATFGVSKVSDFTRKQLLDLYSCVDAGYCHEVCPATSTGKPLNPGTVIHTLKANLLRNGPLLLKKQNSEVPLIGDGGEGSVPEEVIWECTTCGACMEVCRVYVEHVHEIIDMRRSLVQLQAKFPEELLGLFENMEQRSNPWGIAPAERTKWAAELEVKPFESGETEYLFYVGCAGAFDARNRQTTLAVARILNAGGISWGILGNDELCCGDSMRRLGNEYVFDRLARENIKMFAEKGIQKIITQCPHCYHTLKHDYSQYGAKLEVIHHTDLIDHLIKDNKLRLHANGGPGKVVFHDSCYLGRYNSIYEAPRRVFARTTGQAPAEMRRQRNRSFCCGAGGGHMWMEESIGKRINAARVEEALEETPDMICVCCPYCMTMFEDGLKDKNAEDRVKVLDLAEIVARALVQE